MYPRENRINHQRLKLPLMAPAKTTQADATKSFINLTFFDEKNIKYRISNDVATVRNFFVD